LGVFILKKQLARQGMFLIRSELSISAYLFLVLYRFTALQSQSSLKNIVTLLCKYKLVNNHSIPSTHTEKNTVRSHKHSVTTYPSLSLYSPTDGQRNEYTCCAWAGGTESQFVVERKFICDSHNTSLKFNIRVKILLVIYVLICIMFSSLVKRALLNKLFYELIFF
jgi:hypothetical protein